MTLALRSRLVIFLALALALAVTHTLAAPAAEAGSSSDPALTEVRSLVGDHLAAHPRTSRSVAFAQPRTAAATAPTEGATCYGTEVSDPADDVDGFGDVGLFFAGYDCDQAGWLFEMQTYDTWVPAEDFYNAFYVIDKDMDQRTGCGGFDLAVDVIATGFGDADVTAVDIQGGCDGTLTERYLGTTELDTSPTNVFTVGFFDTTLRDYDQALRVGAILETLHEPSGEGDVVPLAGGDACPFNCYRLAAGFGLDVATMFRYGTTESETFVGDWNNDGIDTIGVRIGNEFFLSNSQTGGRSSDERFRFGSVTDEVIVGDWNDDGIDTVGVRRGNEFFLVDSFAGGRSNDQNFRFGSDGDEVLIGDWNADGLDTIGVRKGNEFYLLDTFRGGKQADQQFSYGSVGDPVVIGDWDGDGDDTVGVRKGREWLLSDDPAAGTSRAPFTFGQATDLPFAGDWDGDGVDTPGVRS